MELSCVGCNKNTGNKNPSFQRSKQNRLMFVSNCATCHKKKSRFIKNQEVRKLRIRTPVSDIPLIGNIFFNSI